MLVWGAWSLYQANEDIKQAEREKVFTLGLHDLYSGQEWGAITDVGDALGARVLFVYTWNLDYGPLTGQVQELQRADAFLQGEVPGEVAIVMLNVGEDADYYVKEYLKEQGITLAQATGETLGREGLLILGYKRDGQWWSVGMLPTHPEVWAAQGGIDLYEVVTVEAINAIRFMEGIK